MTDAATVRHAKDLLANPVFRNLMKELGQTYFNDWVASETLDEREEIHAKMKVLSDVVEEINGVIAMHAGDGNA